MCESPLGRLAAASDKNRGGYISPLCDVNRSVHVSVPLVAAVDTREVPIVPGFTSSGNRICSLVLLVRDLALLELKHPNHERHKSEILPLQARRRRGGLILSYLLRFLDYIVQYHIWILHRKIPLRIEDSRYRGASEITENEFWTGNSG